MIRSCVICTTLPDGRHSRVRCSTTLTTTLSHSSYYICVSTGRDLLVRTTPKRVDCQTSSILCGQSRVVHREVTLFVLKSMCFLKQKLLEGVNRFHTTMWWKLCAGPGKRVARTNQPIIFFYYIFFSFPTPFFYHFCCICHLIDSSRSRFHHTFCRYVARRRCTQVCVVAE